MPDEVATATNQSTPSPTDDSGEAQTTSTSGGNDVAPQAPPAGAQDTGFRYTASPGVPDWLVGKTAQETAQIASQLYQSALGGSAPTYTTGAAAQATPQYAAPPNTQQYYGQPPQVTQPQGFAPPSQEEWEMDAQAASQKYFQYMQQTQVAPQLQQTQETIAAQSLAFAQDRHKEEFAKYGPEILNYWNMVPPGQRTIDMAEKVVKVVRADHLDDLERQAEERARKRIEEQMADGSLLRSGTQAAGVATPTGLDLTSEELPPAYRRTLAKYNIDESKLDEFLRGPAGGLYGGTIDERRKGWMEAAKKGDIVTEEGFSI